MKLTIEIPEIDGTKLIYSWEPGFEVFTSFTDNTINIKANKAGLISLARQLLTLAQDEFQADTHFHYDEYNSLEEGSCELIINKL